MGRRSLVRRVRGARLQDPALLHLPRPGLCLRGYRSLSLASRPHGRLGSILAGAGGHGLTQPQAPLARPDARPAGIRQSEQGGRIWSGTFMLLCGAQALGFAHNGLLTPALPLYLSAIGSSEFTIGLVLAAFSLTSFLARPFLGRLADTWSVPGVLRAGALLLSCACLGLGVPNAWAVALANGVRGLGWSGLNTGGYTMLAHVAPDRRRAESASYLSLAQNAPMALAPPLALGLVDSQHLGGFGAVFLLAGASALCGALPALGVRARRSQRHTAGGRA